MQKKSYSITEIVGTSDKSLEDALSNAVRTASKTLKYLGWFQIVENRGLIRADLSMEYQVVLKLGFRYDKSWPASETTPPSKTRR